MSKLLFVPSGIGLGHAVRTHAIIEKVRRKFEYRIATSGVAYDYFDKLGFDNLLRLKGFDFHGEYSFELMQTLVKEANMFFKLAGDYLQISKLSKEFNFDTVISDSDPVGIIAANFMRKRNIVIQNLQDVLLEAKYLPLRFQQSLSYQINFIEQVDKYLTKYADEIIIPSFHKNSFGLKKKHNVGLIINTEVDDMSVKQARKKSFICLPIPGSALTYEIVRELISVFPKFSDDNFYIINFPTKVVKKIKNVYLFPFMELPELNAYLQEARAVITFAGYSTLSQVLYYKKPSLILPLPNHVEQISNATFFRRNKLGEVVYPRKGYDEELLTKMLNKTINNMNEYVENITKSRFSFNGADMTARIISKQ